MPLAIHSFNNQQCTICTWMDDMHKKNAFLSYTGHRKNNTALPVILYANLEDEHCGGK